MQALRTVNRYLYKYRLRFIAGILFILLSNLFGVWAPVYVREGIDLVLHNATLLRGVQDPFSRSVIESDFINGIIYFSLLIILFAFLRGVFLFFMRQTIIVMSRKIEFDQKAELYAHFQLLDPSFYKKYFTGDLMTRITEDISKVRMYYGPGLMYITNLVVLFLLALFQMLKVSPLLTLFTMFPLPIMLVCIFYINRKVEQKSHAIQSQLSELNSFAQEAYSGIRVIKSFALASAFNQRFNDACNSYRNKALSLVKLESIYFPVIALLVGLGMISTVYFGGIQVQAGILSPGVIVEFILYLNMVTWPFAAVGWVTALIQQGAVSQQRINELLSTKPSLASGTIEVKMFNSELVFNKVSFTYQHTGITALRSISFTIKKGSKTAIVGKTGSGKSTLALLCLRAFDAMEGQILLDGIDIKTLNTHSFRNLISYVPQDNFIFSDTIHNNITFGCKNEIHIDAESYAKASSLHDEVLEFQNGYDTIVGERGVTLSGGQKQRLSIARALAKDAPIIILDDALSAVDSITEEKLIHSICNQHKKTLLLITHRLSGLQSFDQIIVMDAGSIAEVGTHDELMQLNGIYADLYAHQPSM